MNKDLSKLDAYIYVGWPESQVLMESDRFDECVLNVDDDAAYFVPYDLYCEIYG